MIDHIRSRAEFGGRRSGGTGIGLRRREHAGWNGRLHSVAKVTEALMRNGYSAPDVRMILGENTLRFGKEVKRAANRLQDGDK